MTDRERIEDGIRSLIATEPHAEILSNKLFSAPGGLFCRLAEHTTEAQRREIASGDLFRDAQRRIRELERTQVRRFRNALASTEEAAATQSLSAEVLSPARS